ncbi:MAG: ATP-binding cassette domain-containing protein, partial [Leptospira sp.]|nr:ATP-binding cassette domain-containing protein [Leptospira sp.]
MSALLEIQSLHASVGDKPILKGVNLTIQKGEVHAIMGPNGSGKSTLSNVILGHPKYQIQSGDILFEGKSILGMPTDERARLGLFLSFQYPTALPGV